MHYKAETFLIDNQEHLEQICSEWIEILKLQQWDIEVTLCKIKQMKDGYEGENFYNYEYLTSNINILDNTDWKPKSGKRTRDMELDLVHELLHCKFAMFYGKGENEYTSVVQEQTIEDLARTLVYLKRRV